jgi:hypothetical protein
MKKLLIGLITMGTISSYALVLGKSKVIELKFASSNILLTDTIKEATWLLEKSPSFLKSSNSVSSQDAEILGKNVIAASIGVCEAGELTPHYTDNNGVLVYRENFSCPVTVIYND